MLAWCSPRISWREEDGGDAAVGEVMTARGAAVGEVRRMGRTYQNRS
jgi:hypothetical protein